MHCGKCRACLNACPTDAFVSPGLLNAELCLSTQTIEQRGVIPPFFSDKLPTAYGCDICQDVCPWNQKHFLNIHDYNCSAKDELCMSSKELKDALKNNNLERLGLNLYRRNLLCYCKDEIDPQLRKAYFYHPNKVVRQTLKQLRGTN